MDNTLPPLSTPLSPLVAPTVPNSTNSLAPENELPILPKKKRIKFKTVAGVVLGLLLVISVGIGSFYLTTGINLTDSRSYAGKNNSFVQGGKWNSNNEGADCGTGCNNSAATDNAVVGAAGQAYTNSVNSQNASNAGGDSSLTQAQIQQNAQAAANLVAANSAANNGYFVPGTKDSNYSQVMIDGDKLLGPHVVVKTGGLVTITLNGKQVSGYYVTTSGGGSQFVPQATDGSKAPAGYYSTGNGDATVFYKIGAVSTKNNSDEGGGVVALNTVADCTTTSWTPPANTVCAGTLFTSISNCGAGVQDTGTKDCSCTTTSWTPDVATKCLNVNFVQTSNCTATRSAVGTKTDGACLVCTNTTWTPAVSTKCINVDFIQTSNCNATRSAEGTKTGTVECGDSPELTLEKKAYEDESNNASGDYHLTTEIDTVSKNQVFVYAFVVENLGTAPAAGITVTDILKGDNQEQLTYVDGDSRCRYTSSTRTVVCSGMNLAVDASDTYKIRVKVSDGAVNGEVIKNLATLKYTDMPTDGGLEASLELNISTVVGCNNICTGDSECVSGLSCDPTTDKCRKAACADSSNCNCAVVTAAPTARATRAPTVYVARVQPTTLPEAGILDFPGVAAFGGGLLLAIVGILLAL